MAAVTAATLPARSRFQMFVIVSLSRDSGVPRHPDLDGGLAWSPASYSETSHPSLNAR